MVDLHQVEPGLPAGHPWKTYSRWQMAWHVFLGVSLVGMAMTLVIALGAVGSGNLNIVESLMPYVFACVIPLIYAVLACVFGPWLARYYPFTQSLIFGAMAVAAVAVSTALMSVWSWIASGPCPPDTYCSEPFDGALLALVLYGFPVFLSASIGFGLAPWSPTRRGKQVFWPLLAGVTAVFVTVLVFANI